MKKLLIAFYILILYGFLVASVASATENVPVVGLNNCQKDYYDNIGGATPRTDYTFLVMDLRIEYPGSNKFSVDPNYFSLKIDGIEYPNSAATYYLDRIGLTALPSVTLNSGSSIEGYIAYEIPRDKMYSGSEIVYSGWQDARVNYRC